MPLETPEALFLIAGSGIYPRLLAQGARHAGVKQIAMAAFEGETAPETASTADTVTWMKVGQMGRLLAAAASSGARHGIMAGQIAPQNLFNLRPDLKALMLLATIKHRNAETLFGAVADELKTCGITLLPATRFLETSLASSGHLAGPKPKARSVEDVEFGFRIAKETSRLDIGQTVVVKNGTVLAVEAFEGTDATIERGGRLGRGASTMVKVSKPNQDLRFDVPVVGENTLLSAATAGIRTIGVEAGFVLFLDHTAVFESAAKKSITLYGVTS